MLLAIDVGNTNIEFGVYSPRTEGRRLLSSFRIATGHSVTSDEIGLLLVQFLSAREIDKAAIRSAAVASVVPQVMHSLGSAVVKYLGLSPRGIGEEIKIPSKNLCKNPKEVGADRLVNTYAAYTKYSDHKKPMLVVDFGTATTFDVCDAEGSYLGGLIYPGVRLSMTALTQNAALLPKVELALPESVIGKDTVSSMQSGVVHGYAGVVKNIAAEVKKELLSPELICVATGGLSSLVGKASGIFEVIDKTLTLDGICLLADLQN